jgi:hypothetical protein
MSISFAIERTANAKWKKRHATPRHATPRHTCHGWIRDNNPELDVSFNVIATK